MNKLALQNCPICGRNRLKEICHVERFPYIGYSVSRAEKEKLLSRYREESLFSAVGIVNCLFCRHNFQPVLPDSSIMDKIYSECYNYPSAMLSGFARERENIFLEFFYKKANPLCNKHLLKRVLEIGCFDGFILKELKKKGFDVFGCDPSKGADIANSAGIPVHKRYFDDSFFIKRRERFDIIIFRHLIEHVSDPIAFLYKVKKILQKKGIIIFETPNAEYYFKHGSFETFNLQHYHNFTLHSIWHMLKRASLRLYNYKITPENLIIIARREGESKKLVNKNSFNHAQRFALVLNRNIVRLKIILQPYILSKKKIVAWGAGGFFGYFPHIYQINDNIFSYVVDNDKRKRSMRFVSNNLSIHSPDILLKDNVDLIIVTSMFSKGILKQIKKSRIHCDVVSLHPAVKFIKNSNK